MGYFVFIIGPLYLALVIFINYQLVRWLAFMFPALCRKPEPRKLAAAREYGERALKRAAKPRLRPGLLWLITILFVGTNILVPVGFFIPTGTVQMVFRRVGYCMMVFTLYLFIAFILYGIIGSLLILFKKLSQDGFRRGVYYRIGMTLCVLTALCMVIYGEVNARIIRVTHYAFTVDKDGGDIPAAADGKKKLRVALIGDLHLGNNAGLSMMKDMVEKINREEVDLVFVAGDIFDNAYQAIRQPDEIAKTLAELKPKYGSYAVFGNHDIEDNLIFGFNFSGDDMENDPRYEKFLKAANMTILKDESVELFDGSVVLVGRRDQEETGLKKSKGEKRATAAELTAGLDKSRILIDLEHEPKEVADVAAAGFDMQLCGHTHNGQFFPMNLGIGFIYFNACGYKVYDGKMHTVTTAGVGSYGPFNRAMVDPEICILDIEFQAAK